MGSTHLRGCLRDRLRCRVLRQAQAVGLVLCLSGGLALPGRWPCDAQFGGVRGGGVDERPLRPDVLPRLLDVGIGGEGGDADDAIVIAAQMGDGAVDVV
ncbi:hypothetical protein EBB59_13110, partial [Lysobacter pythonis]